MTHVRKKKLNWIRKILLVLTCVFLGWALFIFFWMFMPFPANVVRLELPAGALPGSPAETPYANPADYSLSVSWPGWIRAGENGTIRVRLSEKDSTVYNLADKPAQVVVVEPAILALPIQPAGRLQVSLASGQDLSLDWQVEGVYTGKFPGKVYIALGFYNESTAQVDAVPVAVVDLSIRVVDLWGLKPGMKVWMAVISMVISAALLIAGRLVQEK